ncbi:unnamed protein product [Dibothriocephalus latus]|uniref:Tubulin--tyrosine ligase-like protein 5 n=1 Tax=Dibothriocephalus latus TaxID=60516 RepID=A0A3P7L305_DIBLA|nr:unnamed protein product [Dibothriocephalus latus]
MIFRPNIFPEKDETTDKWIMDCQVSDGFSDLSEDPSKSPIMKIEGRDDLSLKALFSSSSFFNRTNTLEEFEASSAVENIEERSERLPSGHNSPVPHKQISQVAKRPRSASTRSRRSSSKKKTDKTEHETRASISGYISRKIRPDSIWLNPILPTPFREAGIVWNGVYKRKPSLVFSPSVMVTRDTFVKILVEKLNMSCKVSKNDCKLLRTLLYSHGLTEMQGYSNEFNLLWTSSHLKPSQLKCLYEFQKINHFPNSFELTRKDRLATNIQRMQILKGFHNFDFVPRTFVLPQDYQDLLSEHTKERSVYIVKPIASSRGRGIYLATNPDNISTDETVIVSRYISNPLLIDGFKFDLRLYVAATSYDPLIVYVYEEGLARFATVRYQFGVRHLKNVCMHLTNYSVNKLNHDFVHNDDADVEDFGNKWSLGALLRYLRSEGKDTAGLMLRIEDIIIKSFIAVESPIVSACHLFQAGKNNCFELYGFDIIVDENLRPWLLEVNLSPSLACDTPLDFKIKSSMIADLLTLAGIQCHDPSRKYNAGVNHPGVNPLVPTFMAPKQPTFFVPARNYLLSELPGAVNGKSCI